MIVVCFNRCLYCGRMTPHEVCHLHSRAFKHRSSWRWRGDFNRSMARAWKRHFYREAEVCDDTACPQKAVDWR